MSDYQLGVIERQFAEMVWDSVPVTASALAKQCESVFGWKKTTAYTVLKRLCNKGLFELNGGMVTAVLSRRDFEEGQAVPLWMIISAAIFPPFWRLLPPRRS